MNKPNETPVQESIDKKPSEASEDAQENEVDFLVWDTFKMPQPLIANAQALNELVYQYPIEIPLPVVADFLKTSSGSLRAAIDIGNFPAGYSWIKPGMRNKGYCIPTTTFYLWYTQRVGIWRELLKREIQEKAT